MFWKFVLIILCAFVYLIMFKDEDFDTDKHVKGKNVLVTGASSGIGEQLAYEYAKMGANVFLTARRKHLLEKVHFKCKDIGGDDVKFDYMAADMELYETTASQVIDRWNGTQEQLRSVERLTDVNAISYVYLASKAIPYLKKSQGHLGVVSSMAGKVEFPYGSIYSMTKFSLDGFFSALRQEFIINKDNISVTVYNLDYIDTDKARAILAERGMYPHMADSKATAIEIIKSSARRERELYYPPLYGSRYPRQPIPFFRHL